MNPEILKEIGTALDLYFEAIPRQKEPNPPALLPLIQSLGELQKKYNDEMESELRHFMQRQSYEKARVRIQELLS
jgi:predicted RNase H-like HicB family nuclease